MCGVTSLYNAGNPCLCKYLSIKDRCENIFVIKQLGIDYGNHRYYILILCIIMLYRLCNHEQFISEYYEIVKSGVSKLLMG